MKQRVLSVALALCLIMSSQSVAYAFQETPAPETVISQETPSEGEVIPQETPSGTDPSADVTPSPQEIPSEEEVIPQETPSGTDPSADVTPSPQETPSEEEVIPQETPSGTDPGTDVTPSPQETPSEEEVIPQETPEGMDPRVSATPDGTISLLNYPTTLMTARDGTIPTPAEAYAAMIALRDQEEYKEGTTWTDYEPYSDAKYYYWKGGNLDGHRISAVGCVAFAFILSDAAFDSLPARMYASGEFSYEDIKVGDILRVHNDTHTVIVLEVNDAGVVVAEGNISTGDHKGKVHWGRAISREEVTANTSHYITRYPENYIPPDDPDANVSIASGNLDGGLAWNLTKAGTLTISGQGAMPDFGSIGDQPWSTNSDKIRKVVIENGVTSVGSCAFWNCGVLSAEISASVTAIGNSAFRSSGIISVTIPSSVKTIGDSAFRECENLSSVTVCEGVETIEQNAFRSCTKLASIALPSTIGEVGAAAFIQCQNMSSATFAPGSRQVKLGDDLFAECFYLVRVTLPVNIDRISDRMFKSCLMLAGVEIPQGAESIGESAFASSGVTTVIIPDSVTMIGIAAFSACPLSDIYFTGSQEQWNRVSKIGDTAAAVSKATIHYNYVPTAPSPSPTPGSSPDPGVSPTPGSSPDPGVSPAPGSSPDPGASPAPGASPDPGTSPAPGTSPDPGTSPAPGTSPNPAPGTSPVPSAGPALTPDPGDGGTNDNNTDNDNTGKDKSDGGSWPSSVLNSGVKAVMEVWKPTTPDEIKRYACVGKETVRYTTSKDNDYPVSIENAVQGPMCFKSFEAVLGDYTIGRTFNIYSLSKNTYSMDEEIQVTIKIPSAIYKENRDYKMICVTKGGQPILYNDLDSDPETITIKTNKFYAYALIYK